MSADDPAPLACVFCEAPLEPAATWCFECGKTLPLPEPIRPCPSCGAEMPEGVSLCAACAPATAALGTPACALHPEFAALRACARCGSFSCAFCLGGKDACRACRERTPGDLLPWDERRAVGTAKAWWRTTWRILSSPDEAFAAARPSGSVGESLLYATIASLVGLSATCGFYGVVTLVAGLSGLTDDEMNLRDRAPIAAGVIAVMAIGALVLPAIGTLALASLDHLALKLIGAEPGSWDTTLRAYSLSLAPGLVGLIPVCGWYVMTPWSIVIRVFAYQHLHRISGGKATAGALFMPAVGVLAVVVGVVLAESLAKP